MSRLTWDEHFLAGAKWAAEMATCPRRSVGALIVNNKRVLATGHNGAPRGQKHCDDVGCLLVDGHCKRSIHAEQNAFLHVGTQDVECATIYIAGGFPCVDCSKVIIQAGILRVVTDTPSSDGDGYGLQLLQEAGVSVEVIDPHTPIPVLISHSFLPFNEGNLDPLGWAKMLRNWRNYL